MSETPPLSRPPRYDPWAPIVAILRRHPAAWFTVDGDTTTATTNINDGVLAAFRPAGAFEARRTDGALEVRYVGPTSSDDEDYLGPGVAPIVCVICNGTGLNEIGRPCYICKGTGIIA